MLIELPSSACIGCISLRRKRLFLSGRAGDNVRSGNTADETAQDGTNVPIQYSNDVIRFLYADCLPQIGSWLSSTYPAPPGQGIVHMALGTIVTIVLCGSILISTLIVLAAVRSARPDARIEALQEGSLEIAATEAMPKSSISGNAIAAGPSESLS